MAATPVICQPRGLWVRRPRLQRRNYDDGVPGALDDVDDLGLLRSRHLELRQRGVQVVYEGVPLVCGDGKVAVRIAHRPSGVLLRPAPCPAYHPRATELEAGREDP